jgi:hypothetical protein
MKRLLMVSACLAMITASSGCCWWHPWGGGYGGYGGGGCGPCGGGACGTPSYYGGGYPTGAYYGGTSMSAALPTTAPYATMPTYTTTAGLPINSLPTY